MFVLSYYGDLPGTPEDRGILSSDLHSDGRHRELLQSDGGVATGKSGYVRMQGNQVFRHAVEKLASSAESALKKTGLTSADVDWIVPHQANKRILDATAKKLGLPAEKVIVTVDMHANTSAASVPLAFDVARRDGRIKPGDLVMFEAMGGGFTWGSVGAT